MVFSSPELTLEEMKLKTLGAKCSTGGTREVPGPKGPSAHCGSRQDAALRAGVNTALRAAQPSAAPLANSRASGPLAGPAGLLRLKCFCLQEGLSGGLEPEAGQWAVRHSWLGGKRQGAGGGGLSRAPALGVNSLTHHGGLHRRRSVSPAWQYGP